MNSRPSRDVLTGLLLAATLLRSGALAQSGTADLKVFSLNILGDTGAASSSNSNAWRYTGGPPRRDRAVRVIADEAPDIAGIQEVETNQVYDLTHTNALSAYGWFGAGRDDGLSAGQHELIFYRSARFVRRDAGVFWLSLTPDTPGSRHPDASQVRIAVWARLLDRQSGRSLLVLSTHWDYTSGTARQYSAELVRSRIASLATNAYALLTGDCNMEPDDPAYSILRGTANLRSLQIRDAYRQVLPVEQPDELTRHSFTGDTVGRRIDYIFHTDEFTAQAAAIVRTSYGSLYPSDHYPVSAVLRVTRVQPGILAILPDMPALTLTWSSVSGLPYRVRMSSNLLAWTDVFPASGNWEATGIASRCTLPHAEGSSAHFYRVVCWPGN